MNETDDDGRVLVDAEELTLARVVRDNIDLIARAVARDPLLQAMPRPTDRTEWGDPINLPWLRAVCRAAGLLPEA